MDNLEPGLRSALMRSVRRRDTSPEMIVRKMAHKMGARYRLHCADLPGTPDIVFPSRRLCIFVHGCFWHRHDGCRLASTPGSNVNFWQEKFKKNVERDLRKELELVRRGWRVATIWECETRKIETLADRVSGLLFPDRPPHPNPISVI